MMKATESTALYHLLMLPANEVLDLTIEMQLQMH